jgi:tetratricopeptide (TPR) repeat protein
MGKRRKSKSRRELPDVDEVLEGRVDPRPEDLFDLVHQVNPTLRGFSRAEQERRYEVKSRLQSLLIRRFGDEHLKVGKAEHDNVVVLDHRAGLRHACHAVISKLDVDAGAWVRRQLDLAASPEVDVSEPWLEKLRPAEDGDEPLDVPGLLELGRRAIETYDYEAAERHLERALEESQAAADSRRLDAALAYLELQVDRLGLAGRALQLEDRLAGKVRENPRVRALLGLAAARLGDRERALALVDGLPPSRDGMAQPRTAEVYATLAAAAIREHDRGAGERFLKLCREHDPTHPEIPQLAAEVAALFDEEMRDAETGLEQSYRERGATAVEDEARAFAERWPGSELARRILREVGAERRRQEIARNLDGGDRAFEEGRFDAAARHLQAALDLGSERPGLAERVAEARERDRRGQEEARVEAVAGQLVVVGGPASREGLIGYLGLSPSLRRRVRERVERPALDWIDALGEPASGAKAHAEVAAIQALERAEEKLGAGDARGVLAELRPHRAVLDRLDAARAVAGAAQERLDAGRRQQAVAHLASAEETFAEARHPQARRLLAKVELGVLAAEDRARAERLTVDLDRVERLGQLEREIERHREIGDPLGTLERVRELAGLTGDDGVRRGLEDQVAELQAEVQKAWRVEVVDETVPLSSSQGLFPTPILQPPVAVVDDDGGRMVLANVWDDWLFLRIVDLAGGEVVRRISARPPDPLRGPVVASWDGDRISVAGVDGSYLELDPEGGEILAWQRCGDLLPAKVEIFDAVPLPGSRHLWIVTIKRRMRGAGASGKAAGWQMMTIDLDHRLVARKLPVGQSWGTPVFRGGEPRMLFNGPELPVKLYSARGTPESTEPILTRSMLFGGVSPDGEGLLLAASSDDPAVRQLLGEPAAEAEADERKGILWEEGIAFVRAEPAGDGSYRLTSGIEFPRAMRQGANMVASSLEEGLGFALVHYNDFVRELLAVEVDGGELRELYRVRVPFYTMLICDRWSRRAYALLSGETEMAVYRLGREPPEIPLEALPDADDWVFPQLESPFPCWDIPAELPDQASFLRTLHKLGSTSKTKARRWIEEYVAATDGDPYHLAYIGRSMRQADLFEQVREPLIRRWAEDNPGHAGFAILLAEAEAAAGNWQQAVDLLRAVEIGPRDRQEAYAAHYHHLLGLGLLYIREPDEALEVFERSLEYEAEGICDLDPLVDLARPMAEEPEAGEWGIDQPVMRQLLGTLRSADRALERGDPEAALEVLERPLIWRTVEIQCAARLAAAHLAIGGDGAAVRYRRRLALAFFLEARDREGGDRREILLPDLSWERERLDELESRAREWLYGASQAAGDGGGS